MKIRSPLIALGLVLAATSAFAATPQPAGKSAVKHHRTCEQRSKAGKCEKWSDAKQDGTAAAKKS